MATAQPVRKSNDDQLKHIPPKILGFFIKKATADAVAKKTGATVEKKPTKNGTRYLVIKRGA